MNCHKAFIFAGFPPLLRQRVKGILRQGRFTLIYKDGPRSSPPKKGA